MNSFPGPHVSHLLYRILAGNGDQKGSAQEKFLESLSRPCPSFTTLSISLSTLLSFLKTFRFISISLGISLETSSWHENNILFGRLPHSLSFHFSTVIYLLSPVDFSLPFLANLSYFLYFLFRFIIRSWWKEDWK